MKVRKVVANNYKLSRLLFQYDHCIVDNYRSSASRFEQKLEGSSKVAEKYQKIRHLNIDG